MEHVLSPCGVNFFKLMTAYWSNPWGNGGPSWNEWSTHDYYLPAQLAKIKRQYFIHIRCRVITSIISVSPTQRECIHARGSMLFYCSKPTSTFPITRSWHWAQLQARFWYYSLFYCVFDYSVCLHLIKVHIITSVPSILIKGSKLQAIMYSYYKRIFAYCTYR